MRSDSSPSPLLDLQPLIHPKEKIYFVMCVFVSLFIYVVLASIILAGEAVAGTVMFYLLMGIIGYFLFHGVFPFLGGAYSRACEYTCDRFGNALEPEGGVDGLLVLAAGRDLYNQVNSTEFINQREAERGFFVRFAEILSTHPNLPKRVAALDAVRKNESAPPRSLIRDAAAVI